MAPTVGIHYAPETGAHQLTLTETPSGHPGWTAYGDWTVVERDGTQIQITSDLDVDALLEVAASLIPAPIVPPSF